MHNLERNTPPEPRSEMRRRVDVGDPIRSQREALPRHQWLPLWQPNLCLSSCLPHERKPPPDARWSSPEGYDETTAWTKPVAQAFLTALDALPDAQRAGVARAAQIVIRDGLQARRQKVKASALAAKSRASAKRGVKAKPAKGAAKRKVAAAE